MGWSQRGILLAIIAIALVAALKLPMWFSLFTLPEAINLTALLILSALFAASLLRLGPRKFLRRLMMLKPVAHGHKHRHDHAHAHAKTAETSHVHGHGHSHSHGQTSGHSHPHSDKHQH